MASLIYGCITPDVEVMEYPVAASQYFVHDGVNAVYLDGSGNVTLALSATATFKGIAIVPKGRGAGTSDTYWLSSATAGSDKIQVITDPEAKFILPAGVSAANDTTVTRATYGGNVYDLVAVNDGTATYVDLGNSTTDMFVIDNAGSVYGGPTTSVLAHINPIKYQAD